MEDDKFYTGGVIHYDDLEELQNFIRQTDGLRLSEEQSNELKIGRASCRERV